MTATGRRPRWITSKPGLLQRFATLLQLPTIHGDESTQRGVEYTTTAGLTTTHRTIAFGDGSSYREVTQSTGVSVASFTTGTLTATDSFGRTQMVREQTTVMPEHQVRTERRLTTDSAGWDDAVPALTTISVGRPGWPVTDELRVERERARTYSGRDLTSETWTTTVRGAGLTRQSSSTYDAASRTLTSRSPLAREAVAVLDAQDRVVESHAPGLYPRRFVYDGRGRLQRTAVLVDGVEQRVTSFGYVDPDVGELWAPALITDPLLETTTIDWTSHFQVASSSHAGRVIGLASESAVSDRVTGITPPGRTTHGFGYSANDELRRYTPPALSGDTDDVQWHYGADGQLEEVDYAGRSVDLRWRPDGRLDYAVAESYSVAYGYDLVTGELRSTTTEDGQRVEVVADGPLLRSVTWSGAGRVAGTMSFGYDGLWQTNSVVVGGVNARYGYDADGLVECVTVDGSAPSTACGAGLAVQVDPEPDAPALPSITTRYPGTGIARVTTDLRWSGFGEPVSSAAVWNGTAESGSLTFDYEARDDLGRITQMSETEVDSLGTRVRDFEYTYDVHQRLTHVRRDGVLVEHYDYDLNGNRTYVATEGRPTLTVADIEHDARDRLVRYGDTRYYYDPQGRLERRERTVGPALEVTRYTYDLFGGLRRVDLADGRVITYRNDGAGRRVERAVDGVITNRWIYRDGLRPIAELDGTNAVRSVFVYGTGRTPDLMVREGRTYRIVTDHLGSIRRVVDAQTGAVVQRLDYDAYGRVRVESGSGFQPLGFAGGIYDADTGLVRFGARDYDAEVGRWTARDPILFDAGDPDLYGYCGAEPIGCVDPSGLDADLDVANWLDRNGVDDFFAGAGDALSFGLTGMARRGMGTDDSVSTCSGAYSAGEISATALSVAFGLAHLGRNLVGQGFRARRLLLDGRTWGSVRRTWSQSVGPLRIYGQSLHHWLLPQRWARLGVPRALLNGGFNYLPISASLNSWMNGSTAVRVAVELGFRATVLGIYGAPLSLMD